MLQRQLAGVQKHSYQIDLTQGQSATIEIDCQGISATISLFDAAGEAIKRTSGLEIARR